MKKYLLDVSYGTRKGGFKHWDGSMQASNVRMAVHRVLDYLRTEAKSELISADIRIREEVPSSPRREDGNV